MQIDRQCGVLLLTLCAGSATLASPAGLSLYGIELGAPLSVQECPKVEQTEMCWSHPFGPKTLADSVSRPDTGAGGDFVIYFASGGTPSISSGRNFDIKITDGVVQVIHISTKGLSVQEAAFKQLSEKFGKPRLFNVAHLQNGFGAKFDRIEAQWGVGPMTVQFFGSLDKVDAGLIVAMTPAALEQVHSVRPEPKL